MATQGSMVGIDRLNVPAIDTFSTLACVPFLVGVLQ